MQEQHTSPHRTLNRSVTMGTHRNIFTTTSDTAVRPKLYFLKIGTKTTKRRKGICSCFFISNLSVIDNLQEGRENFLPSPLYSCWGQQLWALTFTALGAKASSPQGPWEQLSAPQKYCSSCFSLHWLPVSPQLLHLPHALKHPLTPSGFVLWSKHRESDSISQRDSTEIKHLHHTSKRTL